MRLGPRVFVPYFGYRPDIPRDADLI